MKKNNDNKPKEQDERLYSWISSLSSNKNTTVIELIGLPGSGKSTVANTKFVFEGRYPGTSRNTG